MAFGAETITLRQNKCIHYFDDMKANCIERAIEAEQVWNNKHLHQRTIKNLIKVRVIIVKGGKMYLDENELIKFKKSIKRFFMI